MRDECPADRQPLAQLVDLEELVGAFGCELRQQRFDVLDLLIGQLQAARIVAIVRMDAACVLIHGLLHGLLELLHRQVARLARKIRFISFVHFTFVFHRCSRRRLILLCCEIVGQRIRGNLPFCESARHVLLRGTARDIAGGKQAVDGRLAVRRDPEAAGRMAADHIGLRALDLDRLLLRPLAALDPLERLGRRHVEISMIEVRLLLRRDVARIEVAGAVSLAVLLHRAEDALRRREPVLRLVDLALGIDLIGADALRNRARRCDRVLAAQGDKAVLERRHLRAGPDAHRIAGPRVEWGVPHLVAREARVIGPIEPRSAARRNQHGLSLDVVSHALTDREAPGAVHRAIRDLEVRDVDVIEHRDVFLLAHALGQQRLDVLAVDLDVAPAARDVMAFRILEDHEAAALEVFGDRID